MVKSIHDMQFWAPLSYKTEHMRFKVRLNKVEGNSYCRSYFIKQSFCHTFSVIPKAQDYRECVEKKQQYLGLPKNRYRVIPRPVMNLNFYVWFMKAKVQKSRVINNLFYFEFSYKPLNFPPCCPDYP